MTAPATDLRCPHCGEPIATGDSFCESCGNPLGAPAAAATADPSAVAPGQDALGESARTHLITPPGVDDPVSEVVAPARPCASCRAAVGPDGYCTVCGVRASNGREHVVANPGPDVAGVCDKGLVHPRNEDAMALAASADRVVLVVCDGVTTSTNSDIASQAAADVARDLLHSTSAPASPAPAARVIAWADAMQAAGVAGDDAIAAATAGMPDDGSPASCTFVAAVVDGDLIVAGSVGDSRAYWLPDAGAALQLSVDDSWATEQVALGTQREVAEADPRAHAITRWLGPDSPPVEVRTESTTIRSPGWLLLCTDGLWNYCSEPGDLIALIAQQKTSEPTELAEALVAWANQQGGHDNITAAVARLTPVDPSDPPTGSIKPPTATDRGAP